MILLIPQPSKKSYLEGWFLCKPNLEGFDHHIVPGEAFLEIVTSSNFKFLGICDGVIGRSISPSSKTTGINT